MTTRITGADTYAFMKARPRSESIVGAPKLHETPGDGTFTWSIPAGNR